MAQHRTKSEDALRTIGEVADILQVEQHVIRFWEKKFPLIKPVKQRGRRYFTPRDIAILHQVKGLLYEQKYTIRGAQVMLEEKPSPLKQEAKQKDLFNDNIVPAPKANDDQQLDSVLERLKSLQRKLEALS